MSYSAEISRRNPTLFVFLMDQSGSMQNAFGGEGGMVRKADFLADVVNRTLHDLAIRCSKADSIRDYFHVAVLGYGTHAEPVRPSFQGALSGSEIVPISEVANNPARLETRQKKVPDGAGGLVEQEVRFPIWLDPVAENGTPMCAALSRARQLVEDWLREHQESYPPTVLHITDGESTDGDPTAEGDAIRQLASSDGAVMLFNCHLSSIRGAKIEYPNSESALPDDFARLLYRISSPIPTGTLASASELGLGLREGSRGFVFNGDAASLAQFFEIGTRPANM